MPILQMQTTEAPQRLSYLATVPWILSNKARIQKQICPTQHAMCVTTAHSVSQSCRVPDVYVYLTTEVSWDPLSTVPIYSRLKTIVVMFEESSL